MPRISGYWLRCSWLKREISWRYQSKLMDGWYSEPNAEQCSKHRNLPSEHTGFSWGRYQTAVLCHGRAALRKSSKRLFSCSVVTGWVLSSSAMSLESPGRYKLAAACHNITMMGCSLSPSFKNLPIWGLVVHLILSALPVPMVLQRCEKLRKSHGLKMKISFRFGIVLMICLNICNPALLTCLGHRHHPSFHPASWETLPLSFARSVGCATTRSLSETESYLVRSKSAHGKPWSKTFVRPAVVSSFALRSSLAKLPGSIPFYDTLHTSLLKQLGNNPCQNRGMHRNENVKM